LVAAGPLSAIINAAAYTEVDRAETDEQRAFTVNALAVSRLGSEAARRDIPVIHVSTDYVFDGHKRQPYSEADSVAPLNAYGRTKLAGEWALTCANQRHVILRTSWIYSPYRKNFLGTILRLARERDRLTIVADQLGRPTSAREIAQACLAVANHCASFPDTTPYGTYHFAGGGQATWFEFASEIVDMAAKHLPKRPEIVPISTAEYPTPAARPADSRLDCSAIQRAFGILPKPWQVSLADTIRRLFHEEAIA
jgi:dTDP-4-dehydrorhamnose reductase